MATLINTRPVSCSIGGHTRKQDMKVASFVLAGGRKGGVKRQQKRDDLVEQKDRLLIYGDIYIYFLEGI